MQMTLQEVTEAFFNMERSLDLFEQRICTVHFWERIRLQLHWQILEKLGISGQAHTRSERTAVNRSRSALRSLKNAFYKNPHFAPKSDILFFGSPRRKLRNDGMWWDIYCDPIIDHLDRSFVYFESAYLNGHLTPAKTDNIRYLDFPLYFAAVRRKFNPGGLSLTGSKRQLLKDIQEQITARFDVPISLEEIVKRDLLIRKSVFPVYRALLKRVEPRLAFVVCSHGKETFIEACKSMEIPVVELQHGTVSSYHLGYSFPGLKRAKRTFPDYLFVFGDFWKMGVEYPISKDRICSVGYPYLEDETKQYAGLAKKNQIVFISQGTVGEEMSKFAVQLSTMGDFLFEIIYKLHPGEYARWQKEYPWLVGANIQVVDDDQIPLYRLLAESKIQVGVDSTAIYEGLNFGLQTILLDLPGVQHMDHLVKENVARVVASPSELMQQIRETTAAEIQTERFFKPDSLNNIRLSIEELLSTGTSAG